MLYCVPLILVAVVNFHAFLDGDLKDGFLAIGTHARIILKQHRVSLALFQRKGKGDLFRVLTGIPPLLKTCSDALPHDTPQLLRYPIDIKRNEVVGHKGNSALPQYHGGFPLFFL